MGKLKILFVTDHIGGGGAETQFLNLVNNLDKEKFDVSVYICEKKGTRFDHLRKDIKTFGLIENAGRNTLKAVLNLKGLIDSLRPHVVQSWLDYSNFIATAAATVSSYKPVIVASHRGSIEELFEKEVKFGKLKKRLLVWAFKRAGTVTTNTDTLVEQLKRYGLESVRLIYNGIELDCFARLPAKELLRHRIGFVDDIFYVIFVGSLVKRKGVHDLLEAFKQIKEKKIRLIIMGEGCEKRALLEKAAGDRRVVFLGYKENPTEYMKASDLLVLPSIYEGLPNVILEAMAVGTPVLATSVYGVKELIKAGDNGLLVEAGNLQALKEAILRAFNSPDILDRYVARSVEKVSFFTIHRMVAEYQNLYCSLIEQQ